MSQSRQLAAIMFTDIVGYTALMGNNEHKAFQSLAQFKNIAQPLVAFVQDPGDRPSSAGPGREIPWTLA